MVRVKEKEMFKPAEFFKNVSTSSDPLPIPPFTDPAFVG